MRVVISAATQVLAHVPSLVRYGSKPAREKVDLAGSLRTFEQAVKYAPHQAYLGAMHPRESCHQGRGIVPPLPKGEGDRG